MAQWRERSPPTNVTRVRFPDPAFICGLSLLLVLFLAPRVFLRVLRLSTLLKKTNTPNSNFDPLHVHFIRSSKLLRVTWVNKLHFYIYNHLETIKPLRPRHRAFIFFSVFGTPDKTSHSFSIYNFNGRSQVNTKLKFRVGVYFTPVYICEKSTTTCKLVHVRCPKNKENSFFLSICLVLVLMIITRLLTPCLCFQLYIPLTNRVRGPCCKLRPAFFPFDLWPKREARAP